MLVGDDPASAVYVGGKQRASAEVGITGFDHRLPQDATHEQVERQLRELNEDPAVSGILLQLPTPPQVDGAALTEMIDPAKDVDGLTPISAGLLAKGRPGLRPCTPTGVLELLRRHDVALEGAEAVVVGRSDLVGKPVAALLLAANATVTTCHSRTRDLAAVCRRADVLIAAVGRAGLVRGDGVKEGATVIDVGTNRTEAGLVSAEHRLPADASEDEVVALVRRLNADPAIDGILVQLPLPKQIDADRVIETIDPDKDVDGFHVVNAGRLAVGLEGFVPCTPLGCVLLLDDAGVTLEGAEAVVVGRSNLVGKPVAQLLLRRNATVTLAHSRTRDLAAVCRRADVLIAAVGRARMVKGDWVKPGATVIDVGMNRDESGLVGDVDFAAAREVARAITPVPGGVGPMTIAFLLRNTLQAARMQRGEAG